MIRGGLGNDTLRGDNGSDRYCYEFGDGADVIYDTGYTSDFEQDRLILGAGITTESVTLTRSASYLDDVRLSFVGGGSVYLDEQFDTAGEGIEIIEFADGTVWAEADLRVRLLASTDGNDAIYGFNASDMIRGGLATTPCAATTAPTATTTTSATGMM